MFLISNNVYCKQVAAREFLIEMSEEDMSLSSERTRGFELLTTCGKISDRGLSQNQEDGLPPSVTSH